MMGTTAQSQARGVSGSAAGTGGGGGTAGAGGAAAAEPPPSRTLKSVPTAPPQARGTTQRRSGAVMSWRVHLQRVARASPAKSHAKYRRPRRTHLPDKRFTLERVLAGAGALALIAGLVYFFAGSTGTPADEVAAEGA